MQHPGPPQGGSVVPSHNHMSHWQGSYKGVCLLWGIAIWILMPGCHSDMQSSHIFLTHHYAGVELVEALHGAIAEAVAQVFLDKVGMVQDVVRHQRLLSAKNAAWENKKWRDGKREQGQSLRSLKDTLDCDFKIWSLGLLPCVLCAVVLRGHDLWDRWEWGEPPGTLCPPLWSIYNEWKYF